MNLYLAKAISIPRIQRINSKNQKETYYLFLFMYDPYLQQMNLHFFTLTYPVKKRNESHRTSYTMINGLNISMH